MNNKKALEIVKKLLSEPAEKHVNGMHIKTFGWEVSVWDGENIKNPTLDDIIKLIKSGKTFWLMPDFTYTCCDDHPQGWYDGAIVYCDGPHDADWSEVFFHNGEFQISLL